MRVIVFLSIVTALYACNPAAKQDEESVKTYEVISLLGKKLYEPERSDEAQSKLESNLRKARKRLGNDTSEINYIWYGRRMAYLNRYNKAIDIYSKALEKYPDSYKLYRHRGHRYISIRDFDKAIQDFEQAEKLMPKDTLETEPDGIPNKINKPLSSTQFNVYYHLALAYYLKGDFEEALKVYNQCMNTSVNDDLLCATADWKYMTLRRMGHEAEADSVLQLISQDMNIIENDSYHKRLLMYQGVLSPDSLLSVDSSNDDAALALATQGYGVGNYYFYNGDSSKARKIFKDVVEGEYWAAFGFIAAEADLARMK